MIYEPPDSDRIAAYLRARLGAGEVATDSVKRSWPGMSRETWFVDVTIDGSPRRFVFRMDPPGGGFRLTPLDMEARLYGILDRTEVPTQPLLWHEPLGNDWLADGREFFVRSWVDGTVEPDGIGEDAPDHDAARQEVCRELIDKLAIVHGLDWQALGIDQVVRYVPTGPEDAAEVELHWHLRHVREHGAEPYPALTEALWSMRDRLPPPSARVVLRKENNGIGEEIWQGRRIVAMSDWETASLGAPELDLAIAAGTTFRLWDVSECLAYYENVTGTPVNMAAFGFYAQMWAMRAIVGLQGGIPGFAAGADLRLQLASLGLLTRSMQSALAAVAGF